MGAGGARNYQTLSGNDWPVKKNHISEGEGVAIREAAAPPQLDRTYFPPLSLCFLSTAKRARGRLLLPLDTPLRPDILLMMGR